MPIASTHSNGALNAGINEPVERLVQLCLQKSAAFMLRNGYL
jgi:hypothetical protein